MIAGLITARGRQSGFKDNALLPLLGRPLLAYPILAAQSSERVDHLFLSTDGVDAKRVGRNLGVESIDRPAELSLPSVGHPEVIRHALKHILGLHTEPEILVVLLGNVATHEVGIVDKCIQLLHDNPHVDSCVTISGRNEYHPLRAKAVLGSGLKCDVRPEASFDEVVPFLGVTGQVSTNRQDLEPVYFLNHAVWALRPANCLGSGSGQWPGTFMGETVVGIETDHGIDIRSIEDVVFSERWLENHGWTVTDSPYWTDGSEAIT
jgi:CMP-N,N'-diacetyllegionaminic acid synthase